MKTLLMTIQYQFCGGDIAREYSVTNVDLNALPQGSHKYTRVMSGNINQREIRHWCWIM